MAETDYFKQQKAASLNNLANQATSWAVDVKYFRQALDALERSKFEVEDGIILKLQALRQKQLEEYVVKNCYQNRTYNFLQAQKCEEFHYKNDYKLGLLSSFFNDHISKHLKHYEQCWKSPEFEALQTNEDRDMAFVECHDKWLSNLRENVVPELEVRARELLQ
jgi:hypothetical protein